MIFIFIYAITCIGGTYAYFALFAQDDSSIVGVAAVADLDLVVDRVLPTSGDDKLVPQLESALGTAISSQYNCIDGNNNRVCHVYSAVVTNTSSSNVRIIGTISFSGITNMPNLKWKRIDSTTMDVVLEPDASKTYYFVVWIDETGNNPYVVE